MFFFLKIKLAVVMYENKQGDNSGDSECLIENFQVIDPDGEVYVFEIDEKLKPNKEIKIVSKYIKGKRI